MGHAARANPRSFDGSKSERSVLNARLVRFCAFFPDREAYETYLDKFALSDAERAYLETKLPDHLKAQGSV